MASGQFIGVTGSSGKSTTTALIAAVLTEQGSVLQQVMDNTINPLTRTMLKSKTADFVVVEAGVGGKGQMSTMAKLLRPDVAVVTLVGLEHYSAFRSSQAIADEKGALVEALGPDGLAVLNADDPLVMDMAKRTKARIVTFGHSETADCRILGVDDGFPRGISVHLSWRGKTFAIPTQFVGQHFSLAVAASALVGLEMGASVEGICKAIGQCCPLRMRLSVHEIPDGPVILADCAKAPQGTLHLAFDALKTVSAPRRRIVLGSISDYRGSRRPVYKVAVRQALEVADQVILIAEQPSRASYAPEAEETGRFLTFPTTLEAAEFIARTALEGEVILLKGSANLHLERILLAFTTEVRCWENTCGRAETCYKCGLYEHDFKKHSRIRRRIRLYRLWKKLISGPDSANVPSSS